jgi:glycine/D-amino acid oxidase-like deaminating enzyme
MHAPAAGIVTAELICGEKTPFDISPLSPHRFAGAVLGEEGNVI